MEPKNNNSELSNKIQAFLFAEGGTLALKKLEQLTEAGHDSVMGGLDELAKKLDGSGLCILRTDTEATLAVAPRESEVLKAHYGKELSREIGEAGLEVLAVILYRGPSTRAEIDYIRGVNTTSTIRTLLARGLLERAGNAQDSREYLYRPTTALLAHIGASRIEDLPEYGTIASELKAFEASEENDRGPFDDTGYDRNTTDTDGGSAVA